VSSTSRITVLVAAGFAALALAAPSFALIIRSGSGFTAAGITPVRDAFRVDLGGGTVAGANGLFSDATGARREINWDGVPDAVAAPSLLPADFFNVTSPRGVVFSTPGTGFEVSANAGNATATPIEFGNIDPSYPGTFAPFSPQRLFTAIGSNIVDVRFFIPGTTTPAFVRGFGAVFSDVDVADQTTIRFFGPGDVPIGGLFGGFSVPPQAGSETFSFLGVDFEFNIVSRVRITSGTAALAPGAVDQNGDPNDLVVMDDFIYGNPTATTASTFVSFTGRRAEPGVVLRWRTAQEVGSLGFNVYRGPAGHRIRLNRTILRAKGSVSGARYIYRDARALRHSRLRYWLEEVGTDGSHQWRGPLVVSAT
jgi:hypothetical protein